jgi:hypothetical protein
MRKLLLQVAKAHHHLKPPTKTPAQVDLEATAKFGDLEQKISEIIDLKLADKFPNQNTEIEKDAQMFDSAASEFDLEPPSLGYLKL